MTLLSPQMWVKREQGLEETKMDHLTLELDLLVMKRLSMVKIIWMLNLSKVRRRLNPL